MTGKIDILSVEADILRRVAEKVVITNVARLEDGVQRREDAEAGVDPGQVSVMVKRAAGQLDQELTLLNTLGRATPGVIGLSLMFGLVSDDLATAKP